MPLHHMLALRVTTFFNASITSALSTSRFSSRIDFTGRPHLDDVPAQPAGGGRAAVAGDKPLLRRQIDQHLRGKLGVLPMALARQDCAFALPHGSPPREAIDTSPRRRIDAADWNERVDRHLGGDGG